MIRALVSTTHTKILFDDASSDDKNHFLAMVKEKFTVKDTKLERDPRVIRGLMSCNKSFYNEEFDIIQTGLLPFLKVYCKRAEIPFKVIDRRVFKPHNEKLWKQIKKKGLGDKIPRDYQIEAVESLIKYRGGICCMPPGTGKSLIIAILCRIYDRSNFILLFDRVDLLDQTYRGFLDAGFSKDEIDVIGAGASMATGARISMMSLMSYKNLYSEYPRMDVVICDEAHSVGRTDTSEKVIFSCQHASMKFGFSATPDIIDNPYEQLRLYANVGPVVFKKTFEESMSSGTLAETTVIMHTIVPEKEIKIVGSWSDVYETRKVKDRSEEKKLKEAGFEIIENKDGTIARRFVCYGDEHLLYIGNQRRNEKIAEIAMNSERVLILFSKIKHGEILQEMIPGSILIHGKDDRAARDAARKAISDNPKAVVIASSILDVGVDWPAIRNLIIASSHVNSGRIVQKAGRATRKLESIGKLSGVIHDFATSENAIARKQTKKKVHVYEEIMKLSVQWK